jgi:hypothetical protein
MCQSLFKDLKKINEDIIDSKLKLSNIEKNNWAIRVSSYQQYHVQ